MTLALNPLPDATWGIRLRDVVGKSRWASIRKQLFRDKGRVCQGCGARTQLECVERWQFDESTSTQRLDDFHVLCGMCQIASDIRIASELVSSGRIEQGAVIEHFLAVNAINFDEYSAQCAAAASLHEQRSAKTWRLDFGRWADRIDTAKPRGSVTLKLPIEMVPTTAWGQNLRNVIGRSKWDALRKQVLNERGNRCEACEATQKLQCHEEWEFNEGSGVQRLLGFHILCSMCHLSSHPGFASMLTSQGHADIAAIEAHYCRVNNITMKQLASELARAARLFERRSKRTWSVDFGQWNGLVTGMSNSGQQ